MVKSSVANTGAVGGAVNDEIRKKREELERLREKKRILDMSDQAHVTKRKKAKKKAVAKQKKKEVAKTVAKKATQKKKKAEAKKPAKKVEAKKAKTEPKKAKTPAKKAEAKKPVKKAEAKKKKTAEPKKGASAKKGAAKKPRAASKKADAPGKKRRRSRRKSPEIELTDEEEIESGITDEEIANFQVGKANMEQLINRVCEILSDGPSGGTLQGDVWRRLKLTLSDGFRLALKLEWLGLITREKVLENGRWTYRLILKRTPISTRSIIDAPCLTCKVEQKCTPEGEISPHTCDLIRDWVLAESKRSRKRG